MRWCWFVHPGTGGVRHRGRLRRASSFGVDDGSSSPCQDPLDEERRRPDQARADSGYRAGLACRGRLRRVPEVVAEQSRAGDRAVSGLERGEELLRGGVCHLPGGAFVLPGPSVRQAEDHNTPRDRAADPAGPRAIPPPNPGPILVASSGERPNASPIRSQRRGHRAKGHRKVVKTRRCMDRSKDLEAARG